jgi:hypothetical protein
MTLFSPAALRTAIGIVALTWGATVTAQIETLRIQDFPGLGNLMVRVAASELEALSM